MEHLELLSERVWIHTIVLFTHGDCLGDTTIEQHIESEGEALKWLIEKCGNRYHVLNNENKGDVTQITELLEKIEEMVTGNRGGHYKIKRKILEKIERKKGEEERAKQRLMKFQEQRETLRSLVGDFLHLSELRIVLLGYKYGGKSSAGNTILGREEFVLRTDAQCVKRQGQVAGRQVTVVDTPGWWYNHPVEWTPELVKQEIVLSVSLCPPGPHTLLLVIDVGDSFTEEERRAVEEHLALLSETVWSHTIVLFTYGDCLGDTTIEQHIESEGEALRWLVEKCGNRYHVLNNENRGDVTQVTELLEKIEEMVAGNRGGHYEIKREILEKIEERKKAEEERAKQRLMKVQEQRKTLRSLVGREYSEPEIMFQRSSGYGFLSSPSKHHSKRPRINANFRFMPLLSDEHKQKTLFTSDTSNPESQHSSTSTPETIAVVTKLTPETSTEFTETLYRLQCSHAGLFQCSLTGLVFLMEGEGEVLYRTVQWDENLLHSTGQTPAGPLFSIECPQGSICQLHLPHCEILSGELHTTPN
uniref:AIG1-type G domain-containing protein n=1 Tax=Hucho hucho TaxID=62062 RepID=A0A4W5LZ78_9TELE